MKNNRGRSLCPVLLAILALISAACSKGESGAPPAGAQGRSSDPRRMALAFPVETMTVAMRPITYSITAVGSVEAFEKVQVTANVPGVVERVLFSEGKNIKADEVLVEIDTERYRLSVESARATYEKAQAAQADAEAGLHRREAVSKQNPGLIPGEELETWRTKVQLAKSDVAVTLAALNQAKINLHDAYVHSSVGGVIQTRSVQTGQYVLPGTVLATLLRRDPMLLRFQVQENEATQLRIGQKVLLRVRESPDPFTARIVHVAGSADESTRMVAIVAEVNDPRQQFLRPGSFAEVTVPVGIEKKVPVIPQTAIRPSERGFVAFVVRDGRAEERYLQLGLRTTDGQVEVRSGLQPGEQLVIRGAEALSSNVQVRINPTQQGAGSGRPAKR